MKLESNLPDSRLGNIIFIPFLDALFFIILFYFFGSQIVKPYTIPVKLPKSSIFDANIEESHIIEIFPTSKSIDSDGIEQTKDSQIKLNNEVVAIHTLPEAVEKLTKNTQINSCIIRADELSTHGLVTQISSILMEAGYSLSYAVDPKN